MLKWVALLATEGLSKEGNDKILLTVCKDLKYEHCNIPMITQILKIFKEKSFSGDGNAETALEAMKGLSIYFMAPLTEEEVT